MKSMIEDCERPKKRILLSLIQRRSSELEVMTDELASGDGPAPQALMKLVALRGMKRWLEVEKEVQLKWRAQPKSRKSDTFTRSFLGSRMQDVGP